MSSRILVVDDSEVVLKLVEWELKEAGYRVAVARDGRTGLRWRSRRNLTW